MSGTNGINGSTVSKVEQVKARQKRELELIEGVGKSQRKLNELEEAMTAQWASIGDDLRALRDELGWSAKDLAELVELDQRRVGTLLKGEQAPTAAAAS